MTTHRDAATQSTSGAVRDWRLAAELRAARRSAQRRAAVSPTASSLPACIRVSISVRTVAPALVRGCGPASPLPLSLPARCSSSMSVPLSVRSGGLLSPGAAASDDFDGEEADKHVIVQVRLQDVTVRQI